MALVSQLVSLSLRGGLDAKSDRKSVVPGKLLELENATFTAPGRLSKRNGHRRLGTRIAGGEEHVSSIRALMTFRDELVLADGSRLLARSAAGDEWIDRGAYVPLAVTQRPVVRDVYEQQRPDGSRHEATGLELHAWEDSRGGIWWTLLDEAQVVRAPAPLAGAGASRPRVVVVGELFCVLSQSGGRLWLRTLAAGAPWGDLSDAEPLTAESGDYELAGAPTWDATSDGTGLVVAYTTATGGIAVRRWESARHDLVQDFIASVTAAALTVVARPEAGPVVASVQLGSGTVRVTSWEDAELTTRSSDNAAWLGGDASATTLLITGCAEAGEEEDVAIYVGADGTLRKARTPSGLITPVWTWRCRCMPAARPFVRGGDVYLPVVHESEYQPTHFLIAPEAKRIVAKWSPGTAGAGRSIGDHLPETFPRGADQWGVASLVRDRTRVEVGEDAERESEFLFGTQGIVSPTWDFGAEVSAAESGESLYLSGGLLQQYDGTQVVEAGFHLWPEVSGELTGEGNLSEGRYAFVAVYAWTDAAGITHRSAPSLPLQLEATAGAGASITVTPPLTAKGSVVVELYRTEANGTILRRVAPGTVPPTTGGDPLPVTLSEGPSDDDLIRNLPLYTQPLELSAAPVLENHAPPAPSVLAVHRRRLWLVDSAHPTRLWFSKEVGAGVPPEFSDATYIDLDGGPVTALASLDSALVVFRAASIHGVTGQGPDATGQASDFSDAQLITTDVGCIAPRSIVAVSQGLAFQSAKGIHLLTRGMAVQELGAEVDDYLAGVRVRSAVLMPTEQQARWVLSSGLVLVWDYLVGQWSVFTGMGAFDAVIHDGAAHVARESGLVLRETPGVWDDDGAPIRMRVATSWMQLAGLTGFQRVRRIAVLGEMASPHRLRVSLGYDFEPDPSQVLEITPTPGAPFGDVYDFDEGQPYGGQYGRYLWRAHLARQKCTALQVVIEDVPPGTGTPGEAMSLSAVAFEIGVKPGTYRRPAASTMRRA